MYKTANFLGIFTVLSLLGAVALADDEPASREERRVEILERYDADGDGRLSGAELDELREERGLRSEERRNARRQERRLNRWDTDGDGEISDDERATAHQERKRNREANLEKYDADGDGRLNREERRTARADGARVGRPGHGRGHHGGFGQGGSFAKGGGFDGRNGGKRCPTGWGCSDSQ
jgi:Ca2+-binding EF-hand superfamily protein